MINESYPQYAIVDGDNGQMLTDKLNAKLYELRAKNPSVHFDGLIAQISYTETTERPEDLTEEYALKGVRLTCQDCPHFTPILNADGSEDRRTKIGDCKFAHYGRTYRDTPACEYLFNGINTGEVKLCLAD